MTAWRGKKHTDEAKEKIARTRRGKAHSEETKRKIADAQRLRWARYRAKKLEETT